MKKLIINIASFMTFLPLVIAAFAALIYTLITAVFLNIVGLLVYINPTLKAQACLWPFGHIKAAAAWLQAQWSHV